MLFSSTLTSGHSAVSNAGLSSVCPAPHQKHEQLEGFAGQIQTVRAMPEHPLGAMDLKRSELVRFRGAAGCAG
jgi:hypothetical protein